MELAAKATIVALVALVALLGLGQAKGECPAPRGAR